MREYCLFFTVVWLCIMRTTQSCAHSTNTLPHTHIGSAPRDTCPVELATCIHIPGTECLWYRDCLEENKPCTKTKHGYAVEFGLKFCQLFSKNRHRFSPIGKKWVDGVTKCLQFALVPLLATSENYTCSDIRKEAFLSHSNCYLAPGEGVPSVCNMSVLDWGLGAELVTNNVGSSVLYEALAQSFDLMSGCGLQCTVHVCVGVAVMLWSLAQNLFMFLFNEIILLFSL